MKRKWVVLMLSALLAASASTASVAAAAGSDAEDIAVVVEDSAATEMVSEDMEENGISSESETVQTDLLLEEETDTAENTDVNDSEESDTIAIEEITEIDEEDIPSAVSVEEYETATVSEESDSETAGLGVATHTPEEIVEFLKNNNVGINELVTYEEEPVLTAPYSAGVLSEESKAAALAMLNNVRYIAGLSADVTWGADYEEAVQAGTLVNAVNGSLSHYPSQPSDMDDDLYKLGLSGCSSSNIASGYSSLTKAIVYGWMADDDSSNIQSIGHRRWILNPYMGATAFGKTGKYSAMYAFDKSNSDATETAVAWPAQVMPLEYFEDTTPWSVSSISVPDSSAVEVTVTRESDSTTWTFSEENSDDGYFYADEDDGYIVFRPSSISYSDGDVFNVTITGLEETISYTVIFFELEDYCHFHNYTYDSISWASDYLTADVTYTCSCGETYTKTHTAELDPVDGLCTTSETITYTITTDTGVNVRTTGSAHKYEYGSEVTDGTVTKTCSVCGDTEEVGVVTEYLVGWRNSDSSDSYYYYLYDDNYAIGDQVLYYALVRAGGNDTVTSYDTNFVVTTSDESVVSITSVTSGRYGTLTMAGPGTATITVYPKLNPSLVQTYEFHVNDISYYTTSLSATDCTYTGEAQTLAVTVNDGTNDLVEGTDFTASYSNNVNVGTATVTVTGSGDYAGTVTKTFTISQADISGSTVEVSETNIIYDGTEKTPAVTVTNNGRTLESGTDYTAVYSDNMNAGTGAVTLTGIGNYSGTVTGSFTINPADISEGTVTVSDTDFTYDGTAKTPAVAVKMGDTALIKGSDYTIVYSDNTDAGTALVTVSGKGNYTGTATGSFTIDPADISGSSVTVSEESITYDGTEKTPALTVTDGDRTLAEGTDYTAAYADNTDAGTATVTLNGKGNYSGTKTVEFTISPVNLSDCQVSLSASEYTYDGTAKTPSVTVANGSELLTEGTDFAVAYSDNTNAGTATVTVEGMGNYTGTATENFTVIQSDISDGTVTASNTEFTYDGEEKLPVLTLIKNGTTLESGTDYTTAYSDNINAGTGTVSLTGTGNYTGTMTWSFTISPADISGSTVTVTDAEIIYDGTEKEPAVTVKSGDITLVEDSDYTIGYKDNVDAGTASVTVTGEGNYTGTATADFTISRADISKSTVTVSTENLTYDGMAKTPVLTVTDGSRTLEDETDYTAVYANNIEVGTATVTLTGLANYSGTKTVEFTISPIDISSCTVTLSDTEYLFDGTEKVPLVTVTDGSEPLTEGTDYTIAYSDNTKAGTATVTVTGMGNYGGTITEEFIITSISIENGTVTLSNTEYTYDGTEKTPAPEVVIPIDTDADQEQDEEESADSRTLILGTDYMISYSNNTDAGTATATVTGTGNYKGSLEASFTISKADQTITVDPEAPSVEVGKTTSLIVDATGALTYAISDSSVATVDGSGVITGAEAGSTTITIAAAGDDNYNASSITVEITVTEASSSSGGTTGSGSGGESESESTGSGSGNESGSGTTESGSGNESGSGTTTEGGSGSESGSETTESGSGSESGSESIESGSGSGSGSGSTENGSGNESGSGSEGGLIENGSGSESGSETPGSGSGNESGNGSSGSSTASTQLAEGTITSLNNTSKGIKIKWEAVTGASGYYIYRRTASGSYKLIATIQSGSMVSYTDKKVKNKNGTLYTYKVVPYSDNLTGAFQEASIVRLTGTKLSSVKNTSSQKATVKWKKKTKVNGYQIQYSTSKTFKSGNKTVKVSGAKKVSKVLSKLKKGKTYYVRIRTFKKVDGKIYYSAWSSRKTVKIKK